MVLVPITAIMEDTVQISPACFRLTHLPRLLGCTLLLLLLSIPASLWAISQPYLVKEINASGNAINPYLINPFAPLDNAIIFVANDGVNGVELWKSDGTPEGTVLLQDINPGSSSSAPDSLTLLGSR